MIQPTISLEMPVPRQGHYGFHSCPVVDWFCLFIFLWVLNFPLEDCSEFGNFVITLFPARQVPHISKKKKKKKRRYMATTKCYIFVSTQCAILFRWWSKVVSFGLTYHSVFICILFDIAEAVLVLNIIKKTQNSHNKDPSKSWTNSSVNLYEYWFCL